MNLFFGGFVQATGGYRLGQRIAFHAQLIGDL